MILEEIKPIKRKLYFIRANKTKFGGAEVYLSRLSEVLTKQNIEHKVVNSIIPRFLPSWLRVILFNFQVWLFKRDKFYFSLERISCPDIYRSGDGVHKIFMKNTTKSMLNPLHNVYFFLERRCFNNAKLIIANSLMVKNEIINTYGILPEKIKVIYNGVKFKEPNHKSSFEKLSKEFNLDPRRPIMLYVGSGFKRKGVEEFLNILSQLQKKDILAFVIGKDKHIKRYRQLAKKLSVENQVIFTGVRLDVDDFYTISDIFLFPSYYDPFGNVVLEAMQFGNAVFTTQQTGASELLEKDFVMTNSTDFSVVKKIDYLLNDLEKLQEIKERNILKSRQFSIELNVMKTMKIVSRVLNDF